MSEAVPSESIHRRLKYLSLKNSAELLEMEGTDLRQALDSYSAATGRCSRESYRGMRVCLFCGFAVW